MGDEEEDEDQNRIFLWFYGLHLLPSDLARARSELKNKENNPPTAGNFITLSLHLLEPYKTQACNFSESMYFLLLVARLQVVWTF